MEKFPRDLQKELYKKSKQEARKLGPDAVAKDGSIVPRDRRKTIEAGRDDEDVLASTEFKKTRKDAEDAEFENVHRFLSESVAKYHEYPSSYAAHLENIIYNLSSDEAFKKIAKYQKDLEGIELVLDDILASKEREIKSTFRGPGVIIDNSRAHLLQRSDDIKANIYKMQQLTEAALHKLALRRRGERTDGE